MGGEEFFTERRGSDLEATFREAVEKAQYDHGHSGYTGTIGEKVSAILRATVGTWGEAREFARNDLRKNGDDHDKWGPAWAVKVTEPGNVGFLFYGVASS